MQETVTIPLSGADRAREAALRERFARFWTSAQGERREIFDAFVSATPIAAGVSTERVDGAPVDGWWVRPDEGMRDGVILLLHGGGYVQGSAHAFLGLASQLAIRTLRPVFVLDYPLAPEAKVPAAADAALVAYEWLRERGNGPVFIAGDSAGGGLALVILERMAHRSPPASPAAAVLFSPWVDLAFTGASMMDEQVPDPLISYASLQSHARDYLGDADPHDPVASPLYGDLSGLPPLLIQVGSDEHLYDDARQLAARAGRAGSPVRLEVFQGMHHVFQLDVAELGASRYALDRAAQFLTSVA